MEVFTQDQLKNVLSLVHLMKSIRKELKEEGVPIEEYEALFISKELG